MAKITVYLSASIAAYKGVALVRELAKEGHEVRVAMTPAATKLISPATLASLTHYPVLTDLWTDAEQGKISHIALADWTDLAVVAPASADIIAKIAAGMADDAASTALLATAAPMLIVPSMNTHMWEQPSVQRNIKQLEQDGRIVMQPASGYLAEGYRGRGRFPEPDQIVQRVNQILHPQQLLKGKRILITAGGTVEYIDPVRYLGNRSSGKMGIALAKRAALMGGQVTLITGRVSVSVPQDPHIKQVRTLTSEEMLSAVNHYFSDADVLIMAAAVADFKPVKLANDKIKKNSDQTNYQISLQPTPDILASMGAKKRDNQLVVGFAAESSQLFHHAEEKLASKHADMIVANNITQPGIGFGSDNNQVLILQAHTKPESWPMMSKDDVAQKLMNKIAEKLN